MSNAGFSGSRLSPFLVAIEEARNSPLIVGARPAARWKRLAGFIALSFVLMIAASIVIALAMIAIEAMGLVRAGVFDPVPEGPNRLYGEIVSVLGLGAFLGLLAGAVLLSAKIAYGAPTTAFLWPGRPFARRQLWLGFIVMAVVGSASVLIYNLIDPTGPAPIVNPAYSIESRLFYVAAATLGLFAAAAAEEVVFRGVLLRVTGGFTGSLIILCLFNAVVFSAIHLDPDPVAFVARALSGLIWTWAALRLGGIEFAIGAHWAGNLAIALLGEPLTTEAVSTEPTPLSALAYEAVALVVVLIVVERIVRARRAQPSA
ncbi:CPBP family intramembrane glutamic endopeptidase [Brevundimonas sp. UBA5936]|nr:CPBP family intramembrane glutamic endopeptidase [Brevundimonas sp. UBA5936]